MDDPDAQVAKVLSELKDASDLALPRKEPKPNTEATPEGPGAPASTSIPKE
ncbi:putative glucuronoxylan 4-O-methyltransferase 3-like [Sesbania bispinosa]|nr:putative glucuronoxylan 4-O-methyltransferase 3-like [Sesbania bispinosa]